MQQIGIRLSSAAFNTMIRRSTLWLMTGSVLLSMVLAGCTTNNPAPITDIHSSAPSAPAATDGRTYVVQPGDTLYKIAQMHGTDVPSIAMANNITDPSQLRVGQSLLVGGNATVATTTPTAPVTKPVTTATTTPVATETPASTATETPSAAGAVATSSPRASDANLINWGWPTNGTLIQGFSASTKGIDLQGTIGDPIHAAAGGKVMYAGNGVRGLGNLILLGHSNGFITAYAHNDSLLVKTGEEIQKGQKIATLGQTDTSSPRLHFEIRRRGTPVNPMSYLPSR